MAQDNRPTSFIGLGIEGGASHLFFDNPMSSQGLQTTPLLGGGGGAELLYTFEYKHFTVQTGFGASYTFNKNNYFLPFIPFFFTFKNFS